MLKIFLQAGGSGNEDFRYPLRAVKQELDTALLEIGYKEKSAANKHMVEKKLTYQDICRHAEDTYRTMYDRKEWSPARNVRDSRAPPTSFGNLAVDCDTPLTRAEVLTLIQTRSSLARPKTGNCNRRGKSGHWANECPDNVTSTTTPSARHQQHRSRGGHANRRSAGPPRSQTQRSNDAPSWRSTPPATDAPTSKVHNDKTFNWCSKCHRWTTTHTTTTHTGTPRPTAPSARLAHATPRRRNNNNVAANLANLSLLPDPSVWMMDISSPSTTWSTLGFLLSHLFRAFPLLIILFFGFADLLSYLRPLISILATSCQYLFPNLHLLPAPILWLSLGLLIRLQLPEWYRPPDISRLFSNQSTLRRSPFYRTHHRSYPFRLRRQGHYTIGSPPTVEARKRHTLLRDLHRRVLTLQSEVRQHTRRRDHREGECQWQCSLPSTRLVDSMKPWPRRRCPQRRTYNPVLASGRSRRGSTHGLGNFGWTSRQRQAAYKIATHVHMARATPEAAPNPAFLRMALQAPLRFRNSIAATDTNYPIIWDSGASFSGSPNRSDFVGPIKSPGAITQLQGISKGLRIEGYGHVMWAVHDSNGRLRLLKVPAYYAPRIRVRLLSTTSLLQTYPTETIKVEPHQLTLSGNGNDPTKGQVIVRVDPRSNLPTSEAYSHADPTRAAAALEATIANVDQTNINLNESEKELLRWHFRLGHVGFRRVQFLMRSGVLAHSEAQRRLHTAACRITHPPKCAACLYGKQHRRTSPGQETTTVRDRAGILKDGHLQPGQQVSVDHFLCSTKGRLLTSKGRTPEKEMYTGGCLFIDHSSNHVHIEFQQHLTTHQTLEAKERYELACRDVGVVPVSYLMDNAPCFTAAEFKQKVTTFAQIVRFAGVGAHHHNGNAERAIQTIMSIARTMMLHAAIHWPEVADPTLWPLAVSHAVFLHNHLPNPSTGIAPIDIFTKTRWEQKRFHDLHV